MRKEHVTSSRIPERETLDQSHSRALEIVQVLLGSHVNRGQESLSIYTPALLHPWFRTMPRRQIPKQAPVAWRQVYDREASAVIGGERALRLVYVKKLKGAVWIWAEHGFHLPGD